MRVCEYVCVYTNMHRCGCSLACGWLGSAQALHFCPSTGISRISRYLEDDQEAAAMYWLFRCWRTSKNCRIHSLWCRCRCQWGECRWRWISNSPVVVLTFQTDNQVHAPVHGANMKVQSCLTVALARHHWACVVVVVVFTLLVHFRDACFV